MTGIVFLHGWGFGPDIWQDWRSEFASVPSVALDSGYFGPQRLRLPDNAEGWIGIGHSLGFARLLGMDVAWRALVGFGAFLRFCSRPGQELGAAPELLDAMLARLSADPADVLSRFLRRCGHKELRPCRPCDEGLVRLRRDLDLLRGIDLEPSPALPPILLLHAKDDRIVSAGLAQEAQKCLPGARLELLETGGHALPFTRRQDCLPLLRSFVLEHLLEG